MKKYILLLIISLVCGNFIYSQEVKDSLKENTSKSIFYDKLSPKESWELHKKQYSQKLKAKGFSVNEIDKKLIIYDKQKDKFLENLIEQRKIAKLNRHNAEILRVEAETRKKEATVQRQKAKKLRDEAETRRKQAENQRKLAEKWRNSFENVITEKITLTSSNPDIETISFELKNKASLIFKINGDLNSGTTLIEIFNPNGTMEDNFILKYQSNQANKETELKPNLKSLSKLINDADVGIWQLKVHTQKSVGYINISIDKNINETAED